MEEQCFVSKKHRLEKAGLPWAQLPGCVLDEFGIKIPQFTSRSLSALRLTVHHFAGPICVIAASGMVSACFDLFWHVPEEKSPKTTLDRTAELR